MPESVLIHIVIHTVTLLIALLALYFSARSFEARPAKMLEEALKMVARWQDETETDVTRLEGKWKKLNANYASLRAEMRGKAPPGPDDNDDDDLDTKMKPGEDLLTYKQRMRRLLAQGKFRHAGE